MYFQAVLQKAHPEKILPNIMKRIWPIFPSHINELMSAQNMPMVTIFCHIRAELLADSLGDLFVKLVRKLRNRLKIM